MHRRRRVAVSLMSVVIFLTANLSSTAETLIVTNDGPEYIGEVIAAGVNTLKMKLKDSGYQIVSVQTISRLQVDIANGDPVDGKYLDWSDGEIAAMARTTGAPNSLFEGIGADEDFHLLPVPVNGAVSGTYSNTALTSAFYPDLIAPGQNIETVGVSTVLITYNWAKEHPRGQTVDLFTKRFFSGYDELLDTGYHDSWKTIDISEDIPGLTRHWSAEEALKQIAAGRSS